MGGNRLASAPAPDEMLVGVAWYSRGEWPRIRAIAADLETLEASYDDWLKVFNESRDALRQAGIVAEDVRDRGRAATVVRCGRSVD